MVLSTQKTKKSTNECMFAEWLLVEAIALILSLLSQVKKKEENGQKGQEMAVFLPWTAEFLPNLHYFLQFTSKMPRKLQKSSSPLQKLPTFLALGEQISLGKPFTFTLKKLLCIPNFRKFGSSN